MGESHVINEVTMLPQCLQAKKCWAWLAAASTGREAGNRFSRPELQEENNLPPLRGQTS